MSAKYANLPDIDTAPDVYETADTFTTTADKEDSSDDELGSGARPGGQRWNDGAEPVTSEELDNSNLISADEARQRFRKAEKRRPRTVYTYPPSPTSPTSSARAAPISQRIRALRAELTSLEAELADPTKHTDGEDGTDDTGDLIKGLVDIRTRLDNVSKTKEGRGRLVGLVLEGKPTPNRTEEKKDTESKRDKEEVKNIAEMDRRVGELERLIGSSSTALDESAPLPPPLLPMLGRLNNQLTLLSQPRHIDSITRRIKLLLSDLDRVSSTARSRTSAPVTQGGDAPSQLQTEIQPLLARLTPHLPTIPHILTRLRTLSALHTSAAEFQQNLSSLEEEQRKVRKELDALETAVEGVETSLADNEKVVGQNVKGLEDRVQDLLERLERMGADPSSSGT